MLHTIKPHKPIRLSTGEYPETAKKSSSLIPTLPGGVQLGTFLTAVKGLDLAGTPVTVDFLRTFTPGLDFAVTPAVDFIGTAFKSMGKFE